MRKNKLIYRLYYLMTAILACVLLSSCQNAQDFSKTDIESTETHLFDNDAAHGYYYDQTGLYKNIDGTPQCIYRHPVLQVCFYRVGPESSGPVVLTYDPENPVYSSDGNIYGDSIVEVLSERVFPDESSIPDELRGEEFVWLDHASQYGLQINSIWAQDGGLYFDRKVPVQDGYDIYTYWLTGSGVLCVSFEAANPKADPYFSILHPNAYIDKRIQEEIERLDILGIGVNDNY